MLDGVFTVTITIRVAELPQSSVAVNVTSCSPTGYSPLASDPSPSNSDSSSYTIT